MIVVENKVNFKIKRLNDQENLQGLGEQEN